MLQTTYNAQDSPPQRKINLFQSVNGAKIETPILMAVLFYSNLG